MGDAPALELWCVRKSFGAWRKREVLRGVSIRVQRGECYGLAGPNGAGKTTLIRLLLGLSTPDAGEVRLFGVKPEDPAVRARVGFVPESAELPPAASPRALVRRFARLRGLPPETEQQGLAQLDRLGMAELLDRPAGKLSKGEKQRTLLALSLLGAPELLVLDEPTDGLDPLGRALVRRVLHEERAQGRTVFLNSHLLSETERICTRVGILHRGALVRETVVNATPSAGSTAVVLSDPPPAGVEGVRPAPSLQGSATESEGSTVLIDHDDVAQLNAALDRLRAAGAQIVEVRRVRQDLEASFAAAVTDAPQALPDPGERPEDPPVHPDALRPLRAVFRVALEIWADLVSRKVPWIALGIAIVVLGLFFWVMRHDVLAGAAAAVRSFGGPAGTSDAAELGHWIGRYGATVAYWALLPGSILFAALFAPPLLEPRRSILLHAQPVSRGDVAAALFLTVCALVLCEYAFLVALFYAAIRFIGVEASPLFLASVVPLLVAFASLYAVTLVVTYVAQTGLAAGGVAFLLFVCALAAGARPTAEVSFKKVAAAILPRVVGLGEQAARLGGGEWPHAAPFVMTLFIGAALFLVALVVARRSER